MAKMSLLSVAVIAVTTGGWALPAAAREQQEAVPTLQAATPETTPLASHTDEAESQDAFETSGHDITRPSRRFDIRVERESAIEERATRVTLRYDHPVSLSPKWRLNLRMDVPFVAVSPRGDHAAHHDDERGLGDILVHAVFAHHVHENEGYGLGTDLIIPTAGEHALGKGKWRLRPMAGYRWSLHNFKHESFFQLVARYDVSFAGQNDRPKVSEIQFAPNLEIGISPSAFLAFFPNPEIRYNFINDELFVPVNIEVGKNFGRWVLSFEVAKAIVTGDHPPYDWKAEGRVGIRF